MKALRQWRAIPNASSWLSGLLQAIAEIIQSVGQKGGEQNALNFTLCGVPVIYQLAETNCIEVHTEKTSPQTIFGKRLESIPVPKKDCSKNYRNKFLPINFEADLPNTQVPKTGIPAKTSAGIYYADSCSLNGSVINHEYPTMDK